MAIFGVLCVTVTGMDQCISLMLFLTLMFRTEV
jgi:hypothetical protein